MRRMRIVSWKELETNQPMATLVVEWLDGNRVTQDTRYQMGLDELEGLGQSIQAATSKLPPLKELLARADAIVAHGKNVSYPSRASAQFVRDTLEALATALRRSELAEKAK